MILHHVDRPAVGEAVGALVVFHGYGGDPAELLGFVDRIDADRRFHAYLPRAPYAGAGGGTSWFDRDSPASAETQLAPVIEWLDGLPHPRERTVVAGFSQGANVAYSVALGPGYERPAAVIAIAGGFRRELPPDLTRPLPPVAIAHGRGDRAVPVELARRTRDILERAGATVLYRETAAGHEIDGDVVPDLRAFLATLP